MNIIHHFSLVLIGLSFLLIVYSLGKVLIFRLKGEEEAWAGLFASALGFGVLSYLIFGLGMAGWIAPGFLWKVYWGLLVFAFLFARNWWRWFSGLARLLWGEGALSHWFCILSGLCFTGLLVATVAPEIGGDALCYHLGTPQEFLKAGRIIYSPYDVNSAFPLSIQMLYLFAIALKGGVLARFFQLEMGFLLFIAFFLMLKRLGVRQAVFWSLLFIFTPGVVNQMTTAHTDIALLFYLFLGARVLFEAVRESKGSLYCLGGVFLGLAFTVKAVAAFYAVGIGAALLIYFLEGRDFKKTHLLIAGTIVALICFLMVAGPWYYRTYLLTGNPVYPYLPKLFGAQAIAVDYKVGGAGTNLWNLFILPWLLVAKPLLFGNRADQIGPVALLLLPFMILALFLKRESRGFFLAGLLASVFWFLMAQRVRFFYPAFALFFVSSVIGFEFFRNRFIKTGKLVAGLFGLLLIGLVGLGLYHYRFQWKLLMGAWNFDQYRTNLERSKVITDFINSNLPAQGIKILNSKEIHQFYFDRPIVREGAFRRVSRYPARHGTPREVVDFFKISGFTHILIARPRRAQGAPKALSAAAILSDPALSGKYFENIFEADSLNRRGGVYHYILYRIR